MGIISDDGNKTGENDIGLTDGRAVVLPGSKWYP